MNLSKAFFVIMVLIGLMFIFLPDAMKDITKNNIERINIAIEELQKEKNLTLTIETNTAFGKFSYEVRSLEIFQKELENGTTIQSVVIELKNGIFVPLTFKDAALSQNPKSRLFLSEHSEYSTPILSGRIRNTEILLNCRDGVRASIKTK